MPGVINSLSKEGLPLNETTIADYLKAAGYATLAIGKWHQGQQPQYLPLNRGFDYFLGLPFSVDDGTGFVSDCHNESVNTKVHYKVGEIDKSGLGAGLGPQLPLPLIHQLRGGGGGARYHSGSNTSADSSSAARALSEILRQPTDLRMLTAEYLAFVINFTRAHAAQPMFMYLAFSHVHTGKFVRDSTCQYDAYNAIFAESHLQLHPTSSQIRLCQAPTEPSSSSIPAAASSG
jgi:hypothetical protein